MNALAVPALSSVVAVPLIGGPRPFRSALTGKVYGFDLHGLKWVEIEACKFPESHEVHAKKVPLTALKP